MIGRRDFATVLVAHEMDPERRELYVEGRRDSSFLTWLLGDSIAPDTQIVEIEEIESPQEVAGNSRACVLHFAAEAEGKTDRIRCFVDADFDRICDRCNHPANVLLTDYRDLEGYLISEPCFEKLIRLGLNDKQTDTRAFMDEVCRVCRECAYIRITAEQDGLALSFQRTDLKRHLTCDRGSVTIDRTGFVRALFQNSQISLSKQAAFEQGLDALRVVHAQTADADLIHGKDLMAVLDKVLGARARGGSRPDSSMLWTTFERGMVAQQSNLDSVVNYLESA